MRTTFTLPVILIGLFSVTIWIQLPKQPFVEAIQSQTISIRTANVGKLPSATITSTTSMTEANPISTIQSMSSQLIRLQQHVTETNQQYDELSQQYQAVLAQRLGTTAQLLLNEEPDPMVGTLVAIESLKRHPNMAGDMALRQGLELSSWRPIWELPSRYRCIGDMGFSEDGQRLLIVSRNCRYSSQTRKLHGWNIDTQQKIITMTMADAGGATASTSLSQDGHWLVFEQDYQTVEVIDTLMQQQLFTQTFANYSWPVFHFKQNYMAVVDDNQTSISLLSLPDRQPITRLQLDDTVDYRLWSSANGRWLAYDTISNSLSIWNVDTRKLAYRFDYPQNKLIYPLFSHDETILAVSDHHNDGNLRLWDLTTGSPFTLTVQGIDSIYDVKISSDGQWIATTDSDSYRVQVWSISTGTLAASLVARRPLAFSPDNQILVTTKGSNTVQMWRVGSDEELARLAAIDRGNAIFFTYGQRINEAIFSANGQRIALRSFRSGVRVWEKQSELAVFTKTITSGQPFYNVMTTSPNRHLAAIRPMSDSDVRIVDTDTGQEVVTITGFGWIYNANFSSDGRFLALAADAGAIIWDVEAQKEINRFTADGNTKQVAFSDDDKLLAVGVGTGLAGDVYVWEFETGTQRHTFPHTYNSFELAISPDNEWLATRSNIYAISFGGSETQLWNLTTGKKILLLGEEFSFDFEFTDFDFTPDSQWLLSNGGRVWQVETGREVARLSNLNEGSARFSDDGRYIIKTYNDEERWYAWQAADMVEQACQRVWRNLTAEEWTQYVGDGPYQKSCANLPMPQ